MRAYLEGFLKKFDYPQESVPVFLAAYDKLAASEEQMEKFNALLESYRQDIKYDFNKMLEDMGSISEAIGIHAYTGELLLMMFMADILKGYYAGAGMDEKVWYTTMCDLKWKLMECWLVKNVWGTFVGGWFQRHFQLWLFGFEKLQFEMGRVEKQRRCDGKAAEPGDGMLYLHIPRTGGKLDKEGRAEAYRQAAAFYRKYFYDWYGDKPILCECGSWLLYPRNLEVLSPESNLYGFIKEFNFDPESGGIIENYEDAWRLFDKDYEGDPEAMPQDSSLRRAYVDWMRKGEPMGWGCGYFFI